MKFGYARVSTKEQNLDRQIDVLKKYGVHSANLYLEKESGKKKRPKLEALLEVVEPGDEIIVAELTRISRSTKELIVLSEELALKQVELVSLKENIDTSTATGKMLFGMLAVLSQFERDLIVERTQDGLRAARSRGKFGGRPTTDPERIKRAMMLYDATPKMSIRDICTMTGISKATLYKYLEERKLEERE